MRFDARRDVCFARRFAAVGPFGREGGVAYGAFVFFAQDGDRGWRSGWSGSSGWKGSIDV